MSKVCAKDVVKTSFYEDYMSVVEKVSGSDLNAVIKLA